jgi:hypothetical protein
MDPESPEIRPEWVSYRQAEQLTGLGRTSLRQRFVSTRLVPVSRQGRAVRLHWPSLSEQMWMGTSDAGAEAGLGDGGHAAEDRR